MFRISCYPACQYLPTSFPSAFQLLLLRNVAHIILLSGMPIFAYWFACMHFNCCSYAGVDHNILFSSKLSTPTIFSVTFHLLFLKKVQLRIPWYPVCQQSPTSFLDSFHWLFLKKVQLRIPWYPVCQ